MSTLAPSLQAFFTDRLARQCQASPRTIASYRDAFRLLVNFVERETGTAPSRLDVEDLNAKVILAFLDHLEAERRNTPRTRNARLGAIRSFFRYAALRHPEHAETIQQVLAIPQKRFAKPTVSFLTPNRAGCAPRRARPRDLGGSPGPGTRPSRRAGRSACLRAGRSQLL